MIILFGKWRMLIKMSIITKWNNCIDIGSDWKKAGYCVQKQKKTDYVELIHGLLILIETMNDKWNFVENEIHEWSVKMNTIDC